MRGHRLGRRVAMAGWDEKLRRPSEPGRCPVLGVPVPASHTDHDRDGQWIREKETISGPRGGRLQARVPQDSDCAHERLKMTTRFYRNPRLARAATELVSRPGRFRRFARKFSGAIGRLWAMLSL